MTWRSPSWFILGLPLLAAAAILLRRSRRNSPVGRSFQRLVPAEGRWAIRAGTGVLPRPPWLFLLAGFLAVLALAGPQWGQSPRQLLRPSTDLVIALDLSRSMTAQDLAPSRLDRAKLLIRAFLQEAAGQRIGLLVFSSSAQLAVPLTTDYGALEELLSELTPASLPEAGTDFTALLEEAGDTFSQSDAAHRILLILSDGEDHGSAWKERLPRLVRLGVRVNAIGLGTDRGGLIPDPRGGFLKDEGGHPVLSHLQPEALHALASATGGRYFRGDRWVTLAEILGSHSAANAARWEQTSGQAERFAYFLLPAVFCWCASLLWELPAFRSSSRSPSSSRLSAAGSKGPFLLLLGLGGLFSFACFSHAQPDAASASGNGAKETLIRCVQALARKERLSASDYGTLAQETISWCRIGQERGLSAGVIQDGLVAVDQGERLDPRLLPWEQLRKELEAFLKAARPPDAPLEGSSSFSRHHGPSSANPSRFRPAAGGGSPQSGSAQRQRPSPGLPEQKAQSSSSASLPDSSTNKGRADSHAGQSPLEGRNGSKARLRQVERLDRPALLFERMRQKEGEQADVPPEPMDW
ncbi:MAG: VWA domain-containing protein [Methylacidiphilaceae bacterium]|nr:VWA domain-containing protein [Candidatus Methylacidiphilaceae bacterium]